MSIFDQIEKLINEHGSAVILKERLALAADQYAALERKNGELEEENAQLKSQLAAVEMELDRLRQQFEELNRRGSTELLADDAARILQMMFDSPRNLSREEVSSGMALEAGVVAYHFDNLREHRFIQQATVARSGASWVRRTSGPGTPATFTITPAGRKYVVEKLRT